MLDELIACDKEWRQFLTRLNELRHERRLITTEIAALKKKGKDVNKKILKGKETDTEIVAAESKVDESEKKVRDYLMRLPKYPHSASL
jgi:seryl-tRNA synthetase